MEKITHISLANCSECGVKPGDLHENGCDVERCPNCGYQFISCECDQSLKINRIVWSGTWPDIMSEKLTHYSESNESSNPESEIKESKEELLDCIHNLMGCFDTPIGRRLIKDPISDEARKIARKIMDNNGRSVLG